MPRSMASSHSHSAEPLIVWATNTAARAATTANAPGLCNADSDEPVSHPLDTGRLAEVLKPGLGEAFLPVVRATGRLGADKEVALLVLSESSERVRVKLRLGLLVVVELELEALEMPESP